MHKVRDLRLEPSSHIKADIVAQICNPSGGGNAGSETGGSQGLSGQQVWLNQ